MGEVLMVVGGAALFAAGYLTGAAVFREHAAELGRSLDESDDIIERQAARIAELAADLEALRNA